MLQLASPQSPANSTWFHLAVACSELETASATDITSQRCRPSASIKRPCATPGHDLPHGRGGLHARRQQRANPDSTWPEANHRTEPRSDGRAPLGSVALPEPCKTHPVDPVRRQGGETLKHGPPCQELVAQIQVLSWSWSRAQFGGLQVRAGAGKPGSQGGGHRRGPYLALRGRSHQLLLLSDVLRQAPAHSLLLLL